MATMAVQSIRELSGELKSVNITLAKMVERVETHERRLNKLEK